MKRKYILASILIVGMIAGMTAQGVHPPPSYILVSNGVVAIDLAHGGFTDNRGHETLDPLVSNLTYAGNEVVFLEDDGTKKWKYEIPDEASILILTQCDINYTIEEREEVKRWLMLENKLILVAGDSDYVPSGETAPAFNMVYLNELFHSIGAISRFASVSIEDDYYKDGSSYRPAAPREGHGDRPGTGIISDILTAGIPEFVSYADQQASNVSLWDDWHKNETGIMVHSPTSIVAWVEAVSDDNPLDEYSHIRDIREGSISFPRYLEVVYWFSEHAVAFDSDVTDGHYDFYAMDNVTAGENGDYPAVVWEDLYLSLGVHSYMILAGEGIFTFYKSMYNTYTEKGDYGDGIHYGKMFVDNIFNHYLVPIIAVDEGSFAFAFAIIPLAFIGVIYVLMRKR